MQMLKLPSRHPKASAVTAALVIAAILATLAFVTGTPGALAQSDRPAAPTGLTASAGQASGEVQVSWDTYPSSTKDFRLSWAKSGENFRKWTNLDFNAYPTGTSHLVTDLEDGTEYKFRVRARFHEGKSSHWSDVVYATPQAPSQHDDQADSDPRTNHIETPQNLMVESTGYDRMKIVWDAPTDSSINTLIIDRTGGDLSDHTTINTSYSNTDVQEHEYVGLIPNRTYTFKVRFGTSTTDLGPAAEISVTTLELPVPTNFRATLVEYDIVELAWDNPAGVSTTGLYVEIRRPSVVGDDKDGLTEDLGLAANTTSFADENSNPPGITPGTSYFYIVAYYTLDEDNNAHSGSDPPRTSFTSAVVNVPDTLTVSVSDASGTEGGDVVFDISLNRAPQRAVDFWITTDRKSADTTSSNDYSYSSRLITMVRNQTTTTFTVSTNQDTTYEGDETFSVEISLPTNVEIGRGVARGTILEDDPKPTVQFNDDERHIREDRQGSFRIDILIGGISGCPASESFNLTLDISGTAQSGSDYTSIDPAQEISSCQSQKGIPLTLINDNVFEIEQEVLLRIEPGPGYTVGTRDVLKIIITDDDDPPTLEVTAFPGTEGGSNQGSTGTDLANAVFKLELVGNTFEPDIFGEIEYIDGSAKVNEDFDYGSSVFAFGGDAPNPQYLRVPIIDDNVFDGPNRENFFVRFHNLNIHSNSVFIVEGNSMTVENFIIDNDEPAPHQDYVGSNTETLGEIRVGESWVNGNPVSGRIEYENDRDWYRTTLKKNHCYQVDIWGKTLSDEGLAEGLTLEDPSLWGIYDADGYFVWGTDSDDGRGDNRTPRHTMKFRNGGTFYISVSHDLHEFHGGGTFELSLIDLGRATTTCTDVG